MANIRKLRSVNPYTEEVMAEFDYHSTEEAIDILKRLHDNEKWPSLDIAQRADALRKLASGLENNKAECAEIITNEMGKPIKQAIAEIEKCVWTCNYFAQNAANFLTDVDIPTEYKKSYVTIQPLGVVLGIMPWNFPFWQVFRFAVPALLVGNRIAVKHASNVPQCALKIEEIFRNNITQDVYANIFVAGEDTSKLIDSDYVAAISLTGSTEAGSKVAQSAGKNIKKCVLELGGSDPFIVLEDADVEKAAAQAASSRFINAGQSCIAAKRFIVHKAVAEEFTKRFIGKIRALKIGDPMDMSTDIGPLARSDLREQVDAIVRRTERAGAKIAIGGKKLQGKGYFYEPTLLVGVTENMPAAQEELFGCAAPVVLADDEDDAVRIANNSEYGLGASVWTNDFGRAQRLALRINSGFVAINDMVKSDPRLPFGGVKKSGYGRELSYLCVYEFANVKAIVAKE